MSPFQVRPAGPTDIPVLLRMKRQLMISEKIECTFRATEQDWLRDAFGPKPEFLAFVAEQDGAVIGMVTCSERYSTGWAGWTLYVQDLFVEAVHRRRGVGTALLAQVAAHAVKTGNPLVELAVRLNNPARKLYRRSGFQRVQHCATYVVSGPELVQLAQSAGNPLNEVTKHLNDIVQPIALNHALGERNAGMELARTHSFAANARFADVRLGAEIKAARGPRRA